MSTQIKLQMDGQELTFEALPDTRIKFRSHDYQIVAGHLQRITQLDLPFPAGIRAERRAGELLKEMKEAGERAMGRPGKVSADTTLSDLGISRDQSSKWQQLAEIPERKPVTSAPVPAPQPERIAVNAAPQNYDNILPVLRPYMRRLVELEAQMRALRGAGKRLRTSNLDMLSVSAFSSDSGNFERSAANGMAQGYDVSSGLFRRRQAIESGELARCVDGSRTAEILKTGKLRELES